MAPPPDKLSKGVSPAALAPNEPGALPPTHERAYRDYLRSLLADLPAPAELAYRLPDAVIGSLLTARRSKRDTCGTLRLQNSECFQWGLCDRDGFLTAYGMKVRRFLMEEAQ